MEGGFLALFRSEATFLDFCVIFLVRLYISGKLFINMKVLFKGFERVFRDRDLRGSFHILH